MVKSNPVVRDPQRFAAEHAGRQVARCVAASYRSALMWPGDHVVLWVSGPERSALTPGVWGVGRVVAPVTMPVGRPVGAPARTPVGMAVTPMTPAAERASSTARAAGPAGPSSPTVLLDVLLLDEPLPRSALRASAGLVDCEPLRQPRMANPSWLDQGEWAALQHLLAGPHPEAT